MNNIDASKLVFFYYKATHFKIKNIELLVKFIYEDMLRILITETLCIFSKKDCKTSTKHFPTANSCN